MADEIGKTLIQLGFDTTALDKDGEIAVKKTAALSKKINEELVKPASQAGQTASETYGLAFNRAQDKWLNAAQAGFRRWGGSVGGIIADALSAFDKVDKIQFASERLERIEARGAGKAAGTVAENALGTAIGAGAGSEIGSYHGQISKASELVRKGEVDLKRASLITRRSNMDRMAGLGDPTIMDKITQAGMMVKGYAKIVAGKIGEIGNTDLGGVSKFFGGTIGLGVGAAIASIAAVTAAFSTLGKAYDEIAAKRDKAAKNQEIIDSITQLGSTTERTTEILKQFGKYGQTEYAKLLQEQRDLNNELTNSEGFAIYARQAKLALEGLSDTMQNVREGIANLTGLESFRNGFGQGIGEFVGATFDKLQTVFQYTPLGSAMKSMGFEGATTQDSADIIAGEQAAAKGEMELNRKRREKAAREKAANDDIAKAEADAVKVNQEMRDAANDTDDKKKSALEIDIKANEEMLKMLDAEKDKAQYLVTENALKRDQIELGKLEASMKEKEVTNQKKVNDLLEESKNIQARSGDRSKFGLSELSGMAGAPLAPITQPWTRTGWANVRAAREVENLESWSKRNMLEGYTDLAAKQQARADEIRNSIPALREAEKYPGKKDMERLIQINYELNRMAKGSGIKIKPQMGE